LCWQYPFSVELEGTPGRSARLPDGQWAPDLGPGV